MDAFVSRLTIASSRVAVVRFLTFEILLPQPADAGRYAPKRMTMSVWLPYATTMKRQPDFLVSYSFRSSDAGGRAVLPFQGYRSDLRYQQNHIIDGVEYDGNYMVWPEFLTPNETVIDQTGTSVPRAGTAFMWIMHLEQYEDIHRHLATPGATCWFMEGGRKVADCVVIEQIALIHKAIK